MSSSATSFLRTAHGRRLAALVALLSAATAAGTFLRGALSVLSSFVIEEFEISRSQLGVVFMIFALTGGLFSPLMGWLTDSSTRRVMVGLFTFATAGLLIAASAPVFAWLLVAAVIGGLSLASGNPATNKIVSERISMRRRGIVIGVKQAGAPLGLFIAGLLLPPLAALLGWRWALALTALMPVAGLIGTRLLIPRDGDTTPQPAELGEATSDGRSGWMTVGSLAVIGMLVAFGASSIIAFVPLYAQEAVGVSTSVAGLLAASMGLAAVAARVGWGAITNRFHHPTSPMVALSIVAFLATMAIWAGTSAPWLLWLGVIAAGSSMLAWHSIAWLNLLNTVEMADVGKASGLVQSGNSVGYALGPPLFGLLVDTSGSYGPAWALVAGLFGLATILTLVWRRGIRGAASWTSRPNPPPMRSSPRV